MIFGLGGDESDDTLSDDDVPESVSDDDDIDDDVIGVAVGVGVGVCARAGDKTHAEKNTARSTTSANADNGARVRAV